MPRRGNAPMRSWDGLGAQAGKIITTKENLVSFTAGNQEWKKRKAHNGGRKPRVAEEQIRAALEKAAPEQDVLKKLAAAIEQGEAWAITLYLAYMWGKPVERQELTGANGSAVTLVVRYEDAPHGK